MATNEEAAAQLREWAVVRFGDLKPAEAKLLEMVPTGEVCDVSSGDEEKDNPATAEEWGDERVVRAVLIRWLCVDPAASMLVDVKGIQLRGARIDGRLDLEDAKISFGLHIVRCCIREPLTLLGAEVWRVALNGSHTRSITMDGAIVRHGVFLKDGFTALGEVRLLGASIGGDLDCTEGTFENEGGYALHADRMTVKGAVFLRDGFTAHGEVILLGASIGGTLDCARGMFVNEGGRALNAVGMTVKGFVYLRDDFRAQGEVRLIGATVGGTLDCDGGTFENEDGDALVADEMTVKGSVLLGYPFKARGEVRFVGATIGGALGCEGGMFENEGRCALNTAGMTVQRSVYLTDRFTARGEVVLTRASIGGHVTCDGGSFENGGGDALIADEMTVKRSFYLGDGFSFSGSVVLMDASVGVLVDDKDAWPESCRKMLYLDGFEYGAISATVQPDAASRIDWLEMQDQVDGGFLPKPYEQLAKVLREMGRPAEAKKVMIAKEEARREYGNLTGWAKRWHWLIGKTIGYGYRTHLAVIYLVIFVLVGGLFFSLGSSAGLMRPTDAKGVADVGFWQTVAQGEGTPSLIPMWYSLDALVPIVDLRQQRYWQPMSRDNPWGYALRAYLWFHIAMGWFFSTMVVIGLTGIARPG